VRRCSRTRAARVVPVVRMALSVACTGDTAASSSGEPWGSQTLTAPQLAEELAGPNKPVVVCTAPPVMFRAGHIAGAVLHGPATSPTVIGNLRAWAASLPKTSSIVIYCGCCPLEYCPNLRPSYLALKDMGFRQLRVLILPNDFGTDWVRKGFPVER
jgi:thiosulfate/3-mercaptopyruvate sulfurtransferase